MINIGWCISDAPKEFFLPNVRNENLVLTILSELSSIYESILVFVLERLIVKEAGC